MNRNRIFLLAGCTILLFLLFEIFLEDKGLMHLFKLEKTVKTIEHSNKKLENENRRLKALVERLKNDQKYVESVARKELGMVAKDEIIFKFKENRNENRKKNGQ